jgi:hypothetical protein
MKTRFRLIRRGFCGGAFYRVDNTTGRRTSLRTGSEDEAHQLVEARNQAQRQPEINVQIAKANLAAADESFVNHTWQEVMDDFVKSKRGINRDRCATAMGRRPHRHGAVGCYLNAMNMLLLIVVLLLLFGGGGFYFGGPIIGGSGLGLILLICLVIYFMGGFRGSKN